MAFAHLSLFTFHLYSLASIHKRDLTKTKLVRSVPLHYQQVGPQQVVTHASESSIKETICPAQFIKLHITQHL